MIVAVVNEWVVTQVLTIDESEYQKYAITAQAAIDVTGLYPLPEVGWTFTGSALTPPAGYVPSMKITKLAFRNRFTLAELVTAQVARPNNPVLQVMADNLMVATFIDLARPDTISSVQYLVSAGLLTADRAHQVLTTIPTAVELYQG